MADRICPKPVVSINLIDYQQRCGEPHLDSLNAQFAYSKCFDKVSRENLDILRYNEWLRKACTRHAQLGDDNRWTVKVPPSTAQAEKINQCLDYNRSLAAACEKGKPLAQGPLGTNLAASFQTMYSIVCSNSSMQSEVNCVNDEIVENHVVHERYFKARMKTAMIIQNAKTSIEKNQTGSQPVQNNANSTVPRSHVIYAYCVPMNRAAWVP